MYVDVCIWFLYKYIIHFLWYIKRYIYVYRCILQGYLYMYRHVFIISKGIRTVLKMDIVGWLELSSPEVSLPCEISRWRKPVPTRVPNLNSNTSEASYNTEQRRGVPPGVKNPRGGKTWGEHRGGNFRGGEALAPICRHFNLYISVMSPSNIGIYNITEL